MRLLSVLFTAVMVTFLLAGVAAAKEQATGQGFETRKVTDPEPTPENAAQAPEQGAGDARENTACPGARPIGSVGPTEDDLVTTRPFTVTGDSFRLTYETTDADQSGFPFLDVTVLDQAGKEVGGQVIFDEGVVREIVRAGPGRFGFETTAEDLKYKLTIEDCTGGGKSPSDGQNVPTTPVPEDQYKRDVGPPNENDVIDDTISDQPLPNTGGVPLLGLAAFGSIFIFGAFAVLGPVLRRDS
jgi:hypothetical protein